MRVLVTGASGFLGRYVLEELAHNGIEAVAVGRRRPAHGALSAFIEADLLSCADYSTLLREAAASHLIHLAWYAEHGKYWTSPFNLRWVDATTRLIEAFCAWGGRQVVVAGTCAEYDRDQGWCIEDRASLSPETLYGASKEAARRLAMAVCAQHQVSCAWGRVFIPFGTGEDPRRVIPSLIAVFRGTLPAFGVNASACRDFLHVSDVARGLLALLLNNADGTYNVSSGEPRQMGLVVRELARQLHADPQRVLELATARPGEPRMLAGDNSKLTSLGWTASLDLERGIELTLRETPT